MARLVTLYFEDNDAAQKFVDDTLKYGHVIGGSPEPDEPYEAIGDCKVNGLFAVPTKFCECPKEDYPERTNPKRIARGGKLGWWVHRDCGKPLRNSWQSPRNLLDPDMRERNPFIKCTWTFKYNPGLVSDA